MALRSIELFAGGGGLALGLEAVGVRTVCYVEREAYAAAVLAARMGEGQLAPAPVWSDVCTFDGRPWRGVVDLIAGGFPCQDISTAGKRAGIINGERSGLWREFARVVGEVGPRYVFVENVSALLDRGLDVVLGDLASLGFDAEWGVFRASDVGAPHRRERVFVLGHAKGKRRGHVFWRSGPRSTNDDQRTCDASEDVADGACMEHAPGERRPEGRPRRILGRRRNAADDAGERMADPDERGREGIVGNTESPGRPWLDVSGATGEGITGPFRSSASPPWPPGPAQHEEWAAYLARWPGLEPALRRGADGLASRVDRLRVLGNGVCPQQAALAWRVLWGRLMKRVEPGVYRVPEGTR